MMSDFTPQERQTLINMYISQYNQTNLHIERLFDTLDDIRNNINNLIGNNMTSTNRHFNRSNRNNNRHNFFNSTNINSNSNGRRPYIYYDLSNPIDRSTYISDETNNNNNSQDITDFLTTFLNSSVPVRPSQEQINNASRLVRYSDIQNPNSTSCVISLEPFASNDNVIQLNHCKHIFFPDQFNQWFSNHVRCPVCRHDIRTYTNTNTNTTINTTQESTITPVSIDLSNNELSDDLLSTISNRLFTSLLNPSSSNPSDRFVYDPSNNVLLFETILRANNQQNLN
jgi:hypothetical protein